MLGAVAAPGPCGYSIPPTDYPMFYPPAVAAAAGAVLGIAAAVFPIRSRLARGESG